MTSIKLDSRFLASLKKSPEDRSIEDLQSLFETLQDFEALSNLRDTALRSLCKAIRYQKRDKDDILYFRGERASCWYILLSGYVFIDGSMYCPGFSFGKRVGQRVNDCVILEPSEMIVIDYPDSGAAGSAAGAAAAVAYGGRRRSYASTNLERLLALEQDEAGVHSSHHLPSNMDDPQVLVNNMHLLSLYKNSGSRCSSDTSSAYSGSDTMQSLQSGMDPSEDVDLTGLIETTVDSDEDDDDMMATMESLQSRDAVRECLETDPANRTNEDIEILLEFTRHLRAFSNMTLSVRRALCSVMVFAVVQKAGTIVMQDGEELDSWSVIVNGQVEVCSPGASPKELCLGDSFGITPTMEKLYHRGIMRTKCDDCQFVCITQTDYYRILSQGEENTRRHMENGQIVMVTEQRSLDSGSGRGQIVIKGTADHLMGYLMEENSMVDSHFVEDFLLTRRIFMSDATVLSRQLMQWFRESDLKDRVTRVVLQWVNSHFIDFETDAAMMEFLERFEVCLENNKMIGQLGLLNFECAAKSRVRVLTLSRPSRDQALPFCVQGGYERNFGIFIATVEPGSKAENIGLKRGDQLLEVNGQNFERISHTRAMEVLRGATHLSLTVKSNLLAFKEMLQTPDDATRPRQRKSCDLGSQGRSRMTVAHPGSGVNSHELDPGHIKDGKRDLSHKGFSTLGGRTIKLRKALMKAITPKAPLQAHLSEDRLSTTSGGDDSSTPPSTPLSLYHPHSHSNPDLSRLSSGYDEWKFDYPEHVLKVYRSDQSFKYLLVNKETTAREVCMLSLREFSITSDASSNYSLCEVTVDGSGFIKQRRLPDQMAALAERIGLASRYYLRNNQVTDPLVPDELAHELPRETGVHILELNSLELAIQLTLEDFNIFRQIESTEYVDDLFELPSVYGTPSLRQFAELVNKEMFWVITTVCSEHGVVRRMKIIKQFIKLARHCKECRNFNSMFNVLSGLSHGAVGRLKQSWEKLPSKHQKMYQDMLELMDPSRNMSRYRNLINSEHTCPPLIPFYPIAKKDLTFIHLGNDTVVDGLVNFEKLRMIAKEVRALLEMCSVQYDPGAMAEMVGAASSSGAGSVTAGGSAVLGSHRMATVKRRRKSTAHNNPKKMFEEAQMVRRVKAYLSHLTIVQDEDKLMQMSLECEPPPAGSSSSTARRRQPSPTLSTTSTTSSTSANSESRRDRAKFGAASPGAVRKMLALAESKTRPHLPMRAGVLGVSGGVGGGASYHHLPHHPLHFHHAPVGGGPSASTLPLASPSPSPSPAANRRRAPANSRIHERSQSDTLPVDLSTESSSVTSMPLRKTHSTMSSSSGPPGDGMSNSSFTATPLYEAGGATGGSMEVLAKSPIRHHVMYLPKAMPGPKILDRMLIWHSLLYGQYGRRRLFYHAVRAYNSLPGSMRALNVRAFRRTASSYDADAVLHMGRTGGNMTSSGSGAAHQQPPPRRSRPVPARPPPPPARAHPPTTAARRAAHPQSDPDDDDEDQVSAV